MALVKHTFLSTALKDFHSLPNKETRVLGFMPLKSPELVRSRNHKI